MTLRHKFPGIVIPPPPAGMSKAHHATHVVDGLCTEALALMLKAIDYCGSDADGIDALPQVRAVHEALNKLHDRAEAKHRQFACNG